MVDRAALARLGKLVAKDVAAGVLGSNRRTAGQYLDEHPEAVIDLIDMVAAEAHKRQPVQHLVSAYVYLVGQALERIRYGIEGGVADSVRLASEARQKLLEGASSGEIGSPLLLMILREFSMAKLDPGDGLRAAMASAMEQGAIEAAGLPDVEDLSSSLADLARAVGSDPFLVYEEVAQLAGAMPGESRAAMGQMLLQASEPALREAAIGWLLDPQPAVRETMAAAIGVAASRGQVSGAMLRRMITLRNWVPESSRPALDQAIEACRRRGVEPAPWARVQVREIAASGIDGAGALSLFAFAGEGRKGAVASLLTKRGIGLRDAWARHGMTRAEADALMEEIGDSLDLYLVSLSFVQMTVEHALSVNLVSGVMPAFGLLDAMETAGLTSLQPAAWPVDRILGLLEDDTTPEILRPNEVSRALAQGRDLAIEYPFLDFWFEDDDEVTGLLGQLKLPRAKQVALIRDDLLESRREKWVEYLAWTALMLQQSDEGGEQWRDFFISARELLNGRPLIEIPLMTHVAQQTVDTFAASRKTRGRRG